MSSKIVVINSKAQFDGLLKSSRIVVADFFADWCAPCHQIAPLYESLAESLSQPNSVTFVKIDQEANRDISTEYRVSSLPTFIVFRDGQKIEQVKGANPSELKRVVQSLTSEISSLGESSEGASGGGQWKGAEIPRGYSDITDQIETRGCELLNADDDAGPVKVLFEKSKPSALGSGKGSSKDWVQSGTDDQLLLYIPFQSTIKVHTLQITSLPPSDQEDVSRPEVLHLFINRTQNLDFSEADDTEPTQAITLTAKDWNAEGTANIGLRFVKFQKTSSVIIYVQKGEGGDSVRLDRVKVIGEAGAKREMGKLQKLGEDEE